ncbi:hypothetical protein PM082_012315 [Marasmius tenuissimus]|nr:hypothetical protein PM082_012315 [Marasmius tenuissimus]
MAAEEISDSGILLSQRNHLCYVVTGCLMTALWDIITHLRVDFRLLRRTGIHLPQILYIISRIAILAYGLPTWRNHVSRSVVNSSWYDQTRYN